MKYYKIVLPHTKDGYVYPPNYEDEIGVFNQGMSITRMKLMVCLNY